MPEPTATLDLDAALARRAAFSEKVLALQSKVGYIQKDKRNEFHKYKYVSAEAVLSAVNTAMLEARLSSCPIFEIMSEDKTDRGQGKTPDRIVTVRCSLFATDADTGLEQRLAVAFGCGQDTGDKAVMKAQTAALKYAWMTALNIPTGDDPEADETVDKRNEAAPAAPQPTRTYVPGGGIPVSAPAEIAAPEPAQAKKTDETRADDEYNAVDKEIGTKPEPPRRLQKVTGRVTGVQVKTGKFKQPRKDGQTEWTSYVVSLADGTKYSTFDKRDGEFATALADGQDEATITWEPDPTGKYRNLVAIEAVAG